MNLWDRLHFLHRCYRYRFRTERQQLQCALSQDLANSIVLDIGANKGIYSYWLSKAVGPKGAVHAFEPQPEMAQAIRKVSDSFGLANVQVHQMAISSEAGKAVLRREYPGDGGASIEENRPGRSELSVCTATLDQCCEDLEIRGIRFIKCDVEGHELKVFQGALNVLRRDLPLVLFEGWVDSDETELLFQLFESAGYSGTLLMNGGFFAPRECHTIPHQKFGLAGHRYFLFAHKTTPVKLADGLSLGGLGDSATNNQASP